MKVNYKFQIQVSLSFLTIYIDRSIDIELSNFKNFGNLNEFEDYLDDIKRLYYSYFGYDQDLMVSQCDITDLNFFAFLVDIRYSNFDNIRFTGDFVPIVGRHGNYFDFVLYANEG